MDDCFFNIVAVLGILEKWNLQSDQCHNGLEAIQMVKERYHTVSDTRPMYKLILMDFSMPKCDGCKATRGIRDFLKG